MYPLDHPPVYQPVHPLVSGWTTNLGWLSIHWSASYCGKVLQVTGEQLKQVLQEMRGKITPEEGRALVSRALRDRDQADSDKWQVL